MIYSPLLFHENTNGGKQVSICFHSNKSLEDIYSLSNALITIYESKIIHQTMTEIHFRIFNKCSITLCFLHIEDGYLIELLNNQHILYKKEFNQFVSDYCELIK